MRWTIVHDFAFDFGGAERVTSAIASRVLPEADVRVLGADDTVLEQMAIRDRTTLLHGGTLLTARNYRPMAMLLAPVIASLPPIDGNLFSSSYAFSHHVRATGRHVCYCHSPLRQIWSHRDQYGKASGMARGAALNMVAKPLQAADRRAADRVDEFIATSTVVKERIERYFRRDVDHVIPPPVDTSLFFPEISPTRDYFLWAGRIVEPYKKLELAIAAFEGLSKRLVVAGAGRDERRLRSIAPNNVEFVGEVDNASLRGLYANAKALVFPSEDDFGMAPIEAMACGTPVVAYGAGGALDTIEPEETGVLFEEQSIRSLRGALSICAERNWPAAPIVAHAKNFGLDSFARQVASVLDGS